MIDGLVDNRNSALFEELKKDYEIKLELVSNTEEYSCYSINQKSTIYIPSNNVCPASFTHELLHIYLRSMGIFIGSRLKRKLNSSNILSKIYTEQLLEHIGNCLDHIKMLPIYLKLGFDRTKFIHDYEKNKFTKQQVGIIKNLWREGQNYNAPIIEFYLDKYFAAKACPNKNIDYSYQLEELNQIDKQLFIINEKLINRWIKMKINTEDPLEEDYIIIAEDYIAEIKNWVKAKNIK